MSNAQTSAASLRAVTYRLSSTASKQLPHIAPQIAGQLWNCKDLLSSTPETTKQSNDASITVHRFKTQLSTLLQDRTVEGRWSAVVLVKATIEAGGVEVLSKSNGWVRNLLGILKKPDPPTTRNLTVITLTRIFMLTWDYPNLIREITTPALPAFVATCLSNVENKRCLPNELQTVLEAFATLIPRHPTIFRTNESQTRLLIARILSATSSHTPDVHYTEDHRAIAQRVLVALHRCAPKQASGEKWDETLKATVNAAHATCDRLFRSMVEDWRSVAGVQPSVQARISSQGECELEDVDALGLSGWKGVYAGSERLISLFDLLGTHMNTATAGAVTVRIGLVADLFVRLFSLRVPHGREGVLQVNNQISKDEREALFSTLPTMHVAALHFLHAMLHRFGGTIASVVQPLLAQITWVFEAERADFSMRMATYAVLKSVLQLHGPSLAKEDMPDIELAVRACCHDLLPTGDTVSGVRQPSANGTSGKQSVSSNDMSLQTSKTRPSNPTAFTDLYRSAEALLPLCFSELNPAHVPGRLRMLMERTAVLTQHKEALVASVLNPASKRGSSSLQASLLPLLARLYPDDPEVEALLRPRMPVIRTGYTASRDDDINGYDDDSEASEGYANGNTVNGAQDEPEPTDGLLSALGQNDAVADSEDLYSVSPQHRAVRDDAEEAGIAVPTASAPAQDKASEKRVADSAPDSERSAKRLQASPVAETLLPNAADSLPGPDPATAQSRVPTAVVYDQPQSSYATAPEPSQHSVTLPAPPTRPLVSGNAHGSADLESDGSDFEMPPLTMEPDTESDDEEDEEGV